MFLGSASEAALCSRGTPLSANIAEPLAWTRRGPDRMFMLYFSGFSISHAALHCTDHSLARAAKLTAKRCAYRLHRIARAPRELSGVKCSIGQLLYHLRHPGYT